MGNGCCETSIAYFLCYILYPIQRYENIFITAKLLQLIKVKNSLNNLTIINKKNFVVWKK